MSDVQIMKKLTIPTIKVASDDPHKILGTPKKPTPAQAAQRPRGGVPIQPTPTNVQISAPPRISHVTSSSSSQKSEIKTAPPLPPAVRKAQEARAKEAAAKAQVSDHLPDALPAAPKPPAPPATQAPGHGKPPHK